MPVDPIARGLAARANTAAGISAAGGALNATYYAVRLPKSRKALATAMSGLGRFRVGVIGDSNTVGIDSESTGTELKTHSYPSFLAGLLAKMYPVPVTVSSFWGSCGPGVQIGTLNAYDPNIVPGANWADGLTGTSDGLGGATMFNNTNSNALTFTGVEAWDTALVYTIALSGGTNTFTLDVGGTATSFTPANNIGVKSTYSPGSKAVQTVSFKRTAGSNLNLIGMELYDSTIGQITVYNLGHSGAKSSDWASTAQAYSKGNLIGLVGIDLSMINLGLNDFDQAVSIATFTTNMQTIISRQVAAGSDVVLMVPAPPNSATVGGGPAWSEFVAAIKALAVTNNIPVVDFTARFVDYNTMNALGMKSNNLHPNRLGNADEAVALYGLFQSIG